MINAFLNTIEDLANGNDKILLVSGDAGSGPFVNFRSKFPNQFINAGIAEANMITASAGLSKEGFIPFTYAIGAHIVYRPYEQIRNDVCLNNMNVKIVSVGAGLHYADHGPTHQTLEDIAILNVLPNMTIFAPSNPTEAIALTREAARINGPVFIRIGRGGDLGLNKRVKPGKGLIIKEGCDIIIFCTGGTVPDSFHAAMELEKEGISVKVINIHSIKPIDTEIINKVVQETCTVLCIEEHQIGGGLGDIIGAVIMKECNEKPIIFEKMGIDDEFCSYNGSYEGIKVKYRMTKNDIKNKLIEIYKKKNGKE